MSLKLENNIKLKKFSIKVTNLDVMEIVSKKSSEEIMCDNMDSSNNSDR